MALKRGEKRNAISADGWVPELCGDLPSTDSDSHERQKYSTMTPVNELCHGQESRVQTVAD